MAMGFRRPVPPAGPARTGGGLPLAIGTGVSSNPDKVGVGLPVRAPAATAPNPARTTPINKALVWLVNALGLQNSIIPTDLNVGAVAPTLEISGWAGWGLATYTTVTGLTHGAAAAGAAHEDTFIVVPDPVNTQIVVGLGIAQTVTNQGALQCEIGICTGNPIAQSAGQLPLVNTLGAAVFGPVAGFQLPAAPAVGFAPQYLAGILGGVRYLVAPPGMGVYLSCFNQAAGQQQFVTLMVATVPGQFGAGR